MLFKIAGMALIAIGGLKFYFKILFCCVHCGVIEGRFHLVWKNLKVPFEICIGLDIGEIFLYEYNIQGYFF